jgi:hypothetical protein
MKLKFFITILLTAALIQSCTLNMQLMSRDTGTMHNGSLKGFGGTGTLSVQIDEKSARVATPELQIRPKDK